MVRRARVAGFTDVTARYPPDGPLEVATARAFDAGSHIDHRVSATATGSVPRQRGTLSPVRRRIGHDRSELAKIAVGEKYRTRGQIAV